MSFDGRNALLLEDGTGALLLEKDGTGVLLLEVLLGGTLLTNDNTFKPSHSGFTVCERSGFKAKPDALVLEWDGVKVLPEFAEPRNRQDHVRSKAEEQPGPRSGEQTDDFITTRITQDDL